VYSKSITFKQKISYQSVIIYYTAGIDRLPIAASYSTNIGAYMMTTIHEWQKYNVRPCNRTLFFR